VQKVSRNERSDPPWQNNLCQIMLDYVFHPSFVNSWLTSFKRQNISKTLGEPHLTCASKWIHAQQCTAPTSLQVSSDFYCRRSHESSYLQDEFWFRIICIKNIHSISCLFPILINNSIIITNTRQLTAMHCRSGRSLRVDAPFNIQAALIVLVSPWNVTRQRLGDVHNLIRTISNRFNTFTQKFGILSSFGTRIWATSNLLS